MDFIKYTDVCFLPVVSVIFAIVYNKRYNYVYQNEVRHTFLNFSFFIPEASKTNKYHNHYQLK